jgi:hypothetical protein
MGNGIGKLTLCYDGEGDLPQSDVTEGQIYHRKQSKQPEDVETAKKQIASQELWGGPARNFFQSNIPKVKAFIDKLPQDQNGIRMTTGIEFNTEVEPDRSTKPGGVVYWSGEREGIRNEYDALGDEWAKIKVKIRFCNQFDKDYIADD